MDFREKPGSPGDTLQHFGVKGMKWGVRKAQETGGGRPGAQRVARVAVGKNAMPTKARATARPKGEPVPYSKMTPAQKERMALGLHGTKKEDKDGLSPNQKKAIAAVGVTALVGGTYLAYRMHLNGMKPVDMSGLRTGPISKTKLGQIHDLKLKPPYQFNSPHNVIVDMSRGYANVLPKNGFPNPYVAARHAELIDTFEAMRARYPAIRNLNVEVVPMSQVPGVEALAAGKSPAAVMALGKGEARIMYNDLMDGLEPHEAEYVKSMQPGVFTKNFLGNHEMGHLLAVAHGELKDTIALSNHEAPANAMDFAKLVKAQQAYVQHKHQTHKNLFKKHGFTFEELSKLSPYAASEPAEALAELSGHFFTPEFRAKMSPETIAKAEALFNDMGGVVKKR